MTRIPRKHPSPWGTLAMFILFVVALGIVIGTAVSLVRDPPVPPPQSYMGRDNANPWRIP